MAYSRISAALVASSAGSNPGSVSLLSVPSGADLFVAVAVLNDGVSSGELVSAVTSVPSLTWTLTDATDGKELRATDDTGGRMGVYLYTARNSALQTVTATPTLVAASGNRVVAAMVEMTGMLSSGMPDKAASASVATAASSITAGPTATLAQADQTALAVIAGRWWYTFNSAGSGGDPPSGWTKAFGTNDNTKFPFQVAYREVAATTALSAAWDVPASQGDGGVAIVGTFRESTTTLRTRITFKSASGINGVSGLTAKVWRGDSDTNYSATYTGLTAEASGDTLFCSAPAGAVAADVVNVVVYKTGSPIISSEYGTAVIEVA